MKHFILSLLLTFSACSAQPKLKAIPNKTDSLRITWEHSWKDTAGNSEHVLYFKVNLLDQKNNILYSCKTFSDSLNFRPDTFFTFYCLSEGTYYASVTAVDLCCNESKIHYSTDPTAAYGGWYSIIDFTPPAAAFNLSPLLDSSP
jgi:hypothetical protein